MNRKVVYNNIFLLSLILIAFSLPFSIQATSLLTIILLVNWIVSHDLKNKFDQSIKNQWFWLFSSIFFIQAIGLFYSNNIHSGIFSVEKKLSLVIFPLVLSSSIVTSSTKRKAFLSFFISCCLACVLCFIFSYYKYLNHIPVRSSVYGGHVATSIFLENNPGISKLWSYLTYTELTSALSLHPTYLSIYITFLISILAYFLLFKKFTGTKKWFIRLAIVFFSLCLFFLSSRIVIITFFFLIILSILTYFIQKKKIVTGAIITAGLTLFLVSILYVIPVTRARFFSSLSDFKLTVPTYQDKVGLSSGLGMRLVIWKYNWDCIKLNSLMGVGTGDGQDLLDGKYKENNYGELKGFNSHNQYLQLWLTNGIIGLLFFMSSLLLPTLLTKDDYLYKFFLILILICSLTESILSVQKGIVFYSLFNSLFFFQNKAESISKTFRRKLLLLSTQCTSWKIVRSR